MKSPNKNANDVVALIVFLIAAPIISLLFSPPLLVSILFFYVFPAVWLSFREPSAIKRAAVFAFISTVLFFIVDYIAVQDNAWFVSTIFSFRFLGVLPAEDILLIFLGVYLMILFYEHFDDHGDHLFPTRIHYLEAIIGLAVLAFIVFFLFFPKILLIHYAYFWIGFVFLIVGPVVILYLYPRLRFKFLRTSLYIFFLHLSFELTALKLNQWNFPSHDYIGWISIVGQRLPIEEFVIWITLVAVAVLSYYEFYYDDRM